MRKENGGEKGGEERRGERRGEEKEESDCRWSKRRFDSVSTYFTKRKRNEGEGDIIA